jgi:Holliday junction resolvase RusA-like endonuclease
MKIEFFVPEIRGKGRPRLTRNGHAFTDEKTRNYENLVKLLAMQAMEKAGATVTDKPVKATINAHFEIPKSYTKKKVQAIINGEIKPAKPDIDNVIKSIFDGCNKIVFNDDVQIYELTATKSYIACLKQHYGISVAFEWED